MQPIDSKLIFRVYGRGKGWTFAKTDFVADFAETNINKALATLEQSGRIQKKKGGLSHPLEFEHHLHRIRGFSGSKPLLDSLAIRTITFFVSAAR